MKKVIKGALVGGFVLWLWSTVYWAVSGVPLKGMSKFTDEDAVEAVLRANAPTPGYYVLPVAHVPEGPNASELAQARMKKGAEDFFAAGSVVVGGLGSLPGQIGRSLLGNVVAAGLVTLLLLQTAGLSFGRRWLFVETVAVVSWVVAHWPEVVWWGAPPVWSGLLLLDVVAGWGLAGLALAWATKD